MSYLEVRDLVVAYGAIQAVRGVSFSVEKGQIVSLIGSNGAGKTTTLRTISGLLRPVSGTITLDGKPIHAMPAHEILALGVAHSPEGRRLFARMTVEENLRLGAYTRSDEAGIVEDLDRVYSMFPVLGERRRNKAGLFSGGEQQMLAIGRALMSRPTLLMLDEPSMGLSPIMTQQIFATVRELKATGTTVLLVEQNALARWRCRTRRTSSTSAAPRCRQRARAAVRPAGAGGLPRRGRRRLSQ
jgi:branched-chain amino acid transport system ATP-binding protein